MKHLQARKERPTWGPGAWTAVRRGPRYCAPACGGGCTWAAFLAAEEAGRKLAAKLGPGWLPHVWENLGWHYGAMTGDGRLSVFPNNSGRRAGYHAFLSERPGSPGRGTWTSDGRTPRAAAEAVVRTALKGLRVIVEMLSAVEAYMRANEAEDAAALLAADRQCRKLLTDVGRLA